jgi:WD40 repeat protein
MLMENQKTVLQAFSRALGREAHVLVNHPDLLWQQMYNRLQWEESDVQRLIQQEFSRRVASGASTWLWLKTPQHESGGSYRTLNCQSSVEKCLFSPDGNYIVCQAGRMTQIWEMATGTLIQENLGSSPAFSPDGRWIAVAVKEQGICIWDVGTRQLVHNMLGYKDSLISSVFSQDGGMLASACADYTVRVWNAKTGKILFVLDHKYSKVSSCAFSPNKPWIVTGSESGRLYLWNIDTGRAIRDWYGHRGVTDCSFSPDGKLVISAGADETVRIWDAETSKELHTLDDHRDRVYACAFSPDGNLVVTACDDKKVRLYKLASSKFPSELVGHTHFVVTCAFSPNGRWIISGSHDNTVRVWDAQGDLGVRSAEHHNARARACVFSPDGKTIASSGDDCSVRLWDTETGKAVKTIQCHAELEVEDCAFSPDGRSIVSAGWDGTLRVCDIATGNTLLTLEGHEGSGYAADGRLIIGAVHACDYSPRGDLILSGGRDGTLRFWHANTGKLLRTLENRNATAWAFSPDGREFVSAQDGKMKIWGTASGQALRNLDLPKSQGGFESCVYSPDGNLVLFAKGKTLGLWNQVTGELIHNWEGHAERITSCDVSPDGHWIVSASVDRTIKIWHLSNREMAAQMPLPGIIHGVGFHPFAPKLVCCDAGGAVYRLGLVGATYGPIIVTAKARKQWLKRWLVMPCPACLQEHQISADQLDSELTCPSPGCGLPLRLNPFILGAADKRSQSLQ